MQIKIIPYVLTWDGVVTLYHKKYIKELGVANNIEAYIQSRVLKKTLESASFDQRREIDDYSGELEALTAFGTGIAEVRLTSNLS